MFVHPVLQPDPFTAIESSQDSSACSSNDNTPTGRISKGQRRRYELKVIKSRNRICRDAKILKQLYPATSRLKYCQKFNVVLATWMPPRQWDYISNYAQVGDTQ